MLDAGAIEIGAADQATVRIDARVRPIDVPIVNGDPDDGVLRTFDELRVEVPPVEPCTRDRPTPVVDPVDVGPVYGDAGRSLPTGNEVGVGPQAAGLRPPDAATLILAAVRTLR